MYGNLNSKSHKKRYLFAGIGVGLLLIVFLSLSNLFQNEVLPEENSSTSLPGTRHEAMFWQGLDGDKVQCKLCFLYCIIPRGRRGICRVRQNYRGRLYTLVHSRVASWQVMPVEKDTMRHLLPGTKSFAIATASCNLHCQQCQNWSITQVYPERIRYRYWPPEEIVRRARASGSRFISGTMNEPTVFFEYLYDIFPLARAQGVKTMFRTNAMMSPEPLRRILRYTDAVSLDLKGFCDDFHRQILGGKLQPALETLKILRDSGVWFEITNLVIPTLNDNMDDIRAMSEWILENLGPDVPLHFTRFFPAFRLTHLPPTPIRTLEKAHAIARDVGLNFVFIGNVPGHPKNSTFCPSCGERLIRRIHFALDYNKVVDGQCPFCGRCIPGVWK